MIRLIIAMWTIKHVPEEAMDGEQALPVRTARLLALEVIARWLR